MGKSTPSPDHPPPYTGPTTPSPSASSQTNTPPIPGLPALNYPKYRIPDSTVSKDGTEITTKSPLLNSDPTALASFIQEQASLPPLPYIRITGTSSPDGLRRVDFDLKLNMIRYILRSGSGSGSGWNYITLPGDGETCFRGGNATSTTPGLKTVQDWARRYCGESSAMKS